MNLPSGFTDLSGRHFGRLEVLRFLRIKEYRSRQKRALWRCRCICGAEKVVGSASLCTGSTKSCGCLQLERVTKHGYCSRGRISPEHAVWNAMLHRCSRKSKGLNRKHYFDRGIRVCKRWKKFLNFLEDMGLRPGPGYSLDRIHNGKGYFPSNCAWSTRIQQENNKRTNRFVTYKGERKTLAQWCRVFKVPYRQTWARIDPVRRT